MLRTIFIGSKNGFNEMLAHWLAQHTELVGSSGYDRRPGSKPGRGAWSLHGDGFAATVWSKRLMNHCSFFITTPSGMNAPRKNLGDRSSGPTGHNKKRRLGKGTSSGRLMSMHRRS